MFVAVFKYTATIEFLKSIRIEGEMHWNKVHDDTDVGTVHLLDKLSEVISVSPTRVNRVEA